MLFEFLCEVCFHIHYLYYLTNFFFSFSQPKTTFTKNDKGFNSIPFEIKFTNLFKSEFIFLINTQHNQYI